MNIDGKIPTSRINGRIPLGEVSMGDFIVSLNEPTVVVLFDKVVLLARCDGAGHLWLRSMYDGCIGVPDAHQLCRMEVTAILVYGTVDSCQRPTMTHVVTLRASLTDSRHRGR
jgi:hypothetical protein